MKVRFGIGLGTSNVLGDPSVFARFVDRLEELRFDSLWISERVTGRTLDPLTALAFASAVLSLYLLTKLLTGLTG